MKLLICTQAVDLDDPVLGFFHRWIVEFSKRCESVHVICLKQGRHELPANVFVHSLGKESGRSRVKYLMRFYRYIRQLRNEYDTVFVHMNQEYVLLGGIIWQLWNKRIALWRNHKEGSIATNGAGMLCDHICYTSSSAYVAHFKRAIKMPLGIDTEFFALTRHAPEPGSILFLGRLDAVKKVDVFVRALERLQEQGIQFHGDIIGDPTDPSSKYAHDVRNLAAPLALEGIVAMKPAVTNDAARDLFASHAIYVNLTPSGSFDKTIGEAMASGCIVVACNEAVRTVLPESMMPDDTDQSTARAIRTALELSPTERQTLAARSRAFVEKEHSLSLLAELVFTTFKT